VLVDTLSDVTEGLRNRDLANCELHCLPVELPEVQVLQPNSNEPPRVTRNEGQVLDLIRKTVVQQFLGDQVLSGPVVQDDGGYEFLGDADDEQVL